LERQVFFRFATVKRSKRVAGGKRSATTGLHSGRFQKNQKTVEGRSMNDAMSTPEAQTSNCPAIDAYKPGVDRTLLRENLKLTPQQRFEKFHGVMRSLMALRQGNEMRAKTLGRTRADDHRDDAR